MDFNEDKEENNTEEEKTEINTDDEKNKQTINTEKDKQDESKQKQDEFNKVQIEVKKTKKPIMLYAIIGILVVILIVSILTKGFTDTTGITGITGSAAIEKPEGFSLTVLSDERCEDCDTTQVVGQLKSLFLDMEVVEIDYSSKQGKQLYQDIDIEYLPALLFSEEVKDADNYDNVADYLEQKGDYWSLKIGASFDPAAEICNNGIDDNDDGKIDCEDSQCSEKLICREEIPNKLDVFVMSQCPYGTIALDAMKEVLNNFGDDIVFNIYYIANDNGDGTFRSLHGQPEVDENIRELCAIKHYPENYKYMDYIWCRNKNIQSPEWESCAQEAGMEASIIKECFEGEEGKELLRENIKTANGLGIGASPTWLANNQHKFGGIDSETVKSNFCKMNPDLTGCSNTLNSKSDVPAGSC